MTRVNIRVLICIVDTHDTVVEPIFSQENTVFKSKVLLNAGINVYIESARVM